MTYTVTMTSPAHQMLRKLPTPIRTYLVNQAQQLAANPHLGEQLTGTFSSFFSLHTTHKGIHYRIVYEINRRLNEVIVRGVGPRENLYRKLERLRLKPLS